MSWGMLAGMVAGSLTVLGIRFALPRVDRVRFARWRVRRWEAKVAEARAAYQASIDADGHGDHWWERELTLASGKRALWKHRAENW